MWTGKRVDGLLRGQEFDPNLSRHSLEVEISREQNCIRLAPCNFNGEGVYKWNPFLQLDQGGPRGSLFVRGNDLQSKGVKARERKIHCSFAMKFCRHSGNFTPMDGREFSP